MSTLIVTADRNQHLHDYTGAFLPESDALHARHGGTVVRIDQSFPPAGRFRRLLQAVEEHHPDVLLYVGHGLRHSLPQLGATLGNVASLAGALALGSTAPVVVLYACSAADGAAPGGEGGYCDALRDALGNAEAAGCRVYGHATAGHAVRNPYVRVFDQSTALGGSWVVAPGDARWTRWRVRLIGPLRLDFWTFTAAELVARLDS